MWSASDRNPIQISLLKRLSIEPCKVRAERRDPVSGVGGQGSLVPDQLSLSRSVGSLLPGPASLSYDCCSV